jgi:intracellular multiplication protein IcmQ
LSNQELKDKLLTSLDKVILEGHWDQGLFSKNILKRLQSLRQRIVDNFGNEEEVVAELAAIQAIPEQKPGFRRVYAAIYQTDGERMDRWLHMIKNLSDFSASRPIYGEEAHVQELMRSKRGRNDAYVVLWMAEQDILPPLGGQLPFDRFQHELYSLRPKGVKTENIIEFVHDGKCYALQEGRLVLKEG